MAKKIIGAVVAAGAVWLGGTAYIGSQTEPFLDRYVEKTNKIYAQYGMHMSVDSFSKGFFASNAVIQIDFKDPAIQEELNEILTLPMKVDYTIENGPVLFQNGLALGTSRISNHIKLSEHLVEKDEFLKVVKEDITLDSITKIGFSQSASFEAKTNAIEVKDEYDTLTMTPLMMSGDFDVETFQGNMKLLVEALKLKSEYEDINLNDMVLDGEITKFYDNGFYLGDFTFDSTLSSVKTEEIPFEVKEAKVAFEMNINENKDKDIDMNFDLKGDFGATQLPSELSFLKKVELGYALNGTKLEGLLAFQDFSQRIQAKQDAVMQKISQSSMAGAFDDSVYTELEQLQIETENEMAMMIARLLKKDRTTFAVNAKVIDDKAKESQANVMLKYVGDENFPKTAQELRAKFEKEFLELLAFNLNIDLNKEYLANLPADLQQQLSGQLQMGAMFGVVKETNTSYAFEADYKPKTLMVNGEDRSEMLQMLEMGAAQGF